MQSLFNAAKHGNIAYVRDFIKKQQNDNIDAKDTSGWSALHHASNHGQKEIVKMLLQAGADANIADRKNEETAIHLASSLGYRQIVELLLDFGAHPNAVTKCRKTALIIAIANNHLPIVNLLLFRGANIEFVDSNGLTAIEHALECGYVDIVNMLLSHLGLASAECAPSDVYMTLLKDHNKQQQDIASTVTSIIPLIEDINHAKILYTVTSFASRAGFINDTDVVRELVTEILTKTAMTLGCDLRSITMFGLIREKAVRDGFVDVQTAFVIGSGRSSTKEVSTGDTPFTRARDRKSTRLNFQSHHDLVCRLLLEKKKK